MTPLPTPARAKTPAFLKWLLNERAALAGAVATTTLRRDQLEAHLAKAQHQVVELSKALAGANTTLSTTQTALLAMDATLAMTYATVDPGAAGAVQARVGRYGKHGGLQDFVLKALQDAAPAPVPTPTLALMAASHFGIVQNTLHDKDRLRYSVKSTLRVLRERNIVELIPNSTRMRASAWRLKPKATFQEMLDCVRDREQLKARSAGSSPSAPSSDPSDRQMAPERARGAGRRGGQGVRPAGPADAEA